MALEAFGVAVHGRAAAAGRGGGRAGRAAAPRAGAPQPAERARRASRSGSRWACRSTASPSALAEFQGAERRFQLPRRGARRDGGRRLRPPPDRDRGRHRRGARRPRIGASWSCSSRTATRARATCSRRSATRSRAADEVVLTDIYAAGEAPHRPASRSRRWSGGAPDAAAGPSGEGARRTCPPAVAAAGAPERSRDHARRRLDRHVADRSWRRSGRGAGRLQPEGRRDERQGSGREELPPGEGAAGAGGGRRGRGCRLARRRAGPSR